MDVRIDRCTLRGPEAAVRRAHRVLMNCPWPPAGEREVLILRRVGVRGRPEQMSRRLYAVTDELIDRKVDGWSEAAAAADCVVFHSEADMLARLSLDLARGRAAGLWFWQSFSRYWSGPAAAHLPALWLSEAPRLPALCRVLREHGRLREVWRALDESAAEALLPPVLGAGLARQLVALRRPWQVGGGGDPGALQGGAGSGILDESLRAALADFGPLDMTDDGRQWTGILAVALSIAMERPHWLVASNAVQRIVDFVDTCFFVPEPSPVTEVHVDPAPDRWAGIAAENGTPEHPSPPPSPGSGSRSEQRPGFEFTPLPEQRGGAREDGRAAATTLPTDDTLGFLPDDTAVREEPEGWRTRQGGLFYLLNLLNHGPVRERLLADPQALAFPSGWGWLYRLGEALGLEPEPSLLLLFARLAGLPPEALPEQFPPLDAALEIHAYGERRYGRFGIWGPGLLRIPARITYRRPELDIHLPQAELDIAVRRAALDLDPGWVDWLGTVVRFHYR